MARRRGAEAARIGDIGELARPPPAGLSRTTRAYLHEQARYDKCFVDGWHPLGATSDGRADDLIKTSGHLISALSTSNGPIR